MAEYINCEDAYDYQTLEDWYINSIDSTISPVWTGEHIEELLNDFYIIPKDTPTIEAEQVRHGEWIEKKQPHGGIFDYCFVCSECHKKTPDGAFVISPNYCPFCGAKMNLEVN